MSGKLKWGKIFCLSMMLVGVVPAEGVGGRVPEKKSESQYRTLCAEKHPKMGMGECVSAYQRREAYRRRHKMKEQGAAEPQQGIGDRRSENRREAYHRRKMKEREPVERRPVIERPSSR